jgi:hypothetical protein
MRSSLGLILFLAACGSSGGGGGGGGGGPDAADPNGTPAISVTTPDIMLTAGQEVTYCYYFHTNNTSTVAINKWSSTMSPGSHHIIVFTGGPNHADGLDMTNSCGFGGTTGTNQPAWTYSAQTPENELDLPADDGTGKPLAQPIAANTQGAIQMHYINNTDNTITAHDTLHGYALPDGAAFTQTAPYITYNNSISIGPNATGVVASATCSVPTEKFWLMGTHAHKQEIKADVLDGSSLVLETTSWEHPETKLWNASPFYTFTGGKLTWSCTYDNTGDNKNSTVVAGQSAATNEMCMASGYFFPATAAKFCLYDNSIPTADHCYCQ